MVLVERVHAIEFDVKVVVVVVVILETIKFILVECDFREFTGLRVI